MGASGQRLGGSGSPIDADGEFCSGCHLDYSCISAGKFKWPGKEERGLGSQGLLMKSFQPPASPRNQAFEGAHGPLVWFLTVQSLALRCGAGAGDADAGAPGHPAPSDLKSNVSGTETSPPALAFQFAQDPCLLSSSSWN